MFVTISPNEIIIRRVKMVSITMLFRYVENEINTSDLMALTA